ncbi:MAG: tetraacyldisaccharide 4'-kinase, partial [Candidatus Omnitrophica bacterium]|nr:tetraacyldisaccharide 4'-kinase [Candidatus Omnitrophota bacterium]
KTNADEPILISSALKEADVIFGKNRRTLLFSVIKKNPDLIIIDDGFQYFDIQNKIDIILINPETPVNFLIPAGRMRFPFCFFKYADAIVINQTYQKKARHEKIIKKLENSGKPVFTVRYTPSYFINLKNEKVSLSTVQNRKILAVCGIGRPEGFVNTVLKLLPECVYAAFYPDHFAYNKKDILELQEIFLRLNLDMVVTTEKDIVKLKKFKIDFPVYGL